MPIQLLYLCSYAMQSVPHGPHFFLFYHLRDITKYSFEVVSETSLCCRSQVVSVRALHDGAIRTGTYDPHRRWPGRQGSIQNSLIRLAATRRILRHNCCIRCSLYGIRCCLYGTMEAFLYVCVIAFVVREHIWNCPTIILKNNHITKNKLDYGIINYTILKFDSSLKITVILYVAIVFWKKPHCPMAVRAWKAPS